MRAYVEIDLDNLRHNIGVLKSKISSDKIIAVLKANAYGCGVENIFNVLLSEKIYNFAVATYDEAIQLQKLNNKVNILILGPIDKKLYKEIENTNISITVSNFEELNYLLENSLKNKIHLKLDTGMTRLGFFEKDIDKLDEYILNDKLNIVGIFSHISDTDNYDYTMNQISTFDKITSKYSLKKHILSSGSFEKLYKTKYVYDYVRIGISLYSGLENDEYRQVMSFYSKVVSVRKVEKNSYVGYSRTYEIEKDKYIATVSVGYADGYKRKLSNKSKVYINGKKYNVVGNICMDLMMVEVDENVKVDDRVELFGNNISIYEISKLSDTINYEILTSITNRVKKVCKGEL